ncbi:carbohydrate ABC transporter permease [Anaerotaenia torta]|uniref:carbohydrate ABC transporter permease n=1 Tax=Anaerotaenia torta TaxID=433293 RepID=UPI003D25F0BD
MVKAMYFKKHKGKLRLTLRGKEAMAGLLFLIPFLMGLLGVFLPMIMQSIRFSFSNLEVTSAGMSIRTAAKGGLEHYIRALTIDPEYNRMLLNAMAEMAASVPLIIIFSFFAANLLNQKFRGRTAVRSIFFFPVLLSSGAILSLETSDLLLNSANLAQTGGDDIASFLNVAILLVTYTDLPVNVVIFLADAVNGVYNIIIASGVQILIFLAGLQSISPSLYEASDIEGATAWESFWKITFPMISPLILVNSVYTIIDSFTSATNGMMTEIQTTIFKDIKYGFGSAMAWIYFICIALVLLIVGSVISKRVFYYDEK